MTRAGNRKRNWNWIHAGLLIALGAALPPGAAQAKGTAAKAKAADGPPVVFSIHGLFTDVTKPAPNGGMTGWSDLRTAHITLPAGDYWIYADFVQAVREVCDVRFALLGADGKARQGDVLNTNSGDTYGRVAQEITLASPFSGDVSYGGGGFKPTKMWFRVVPATAQAFLPFAFGAVPKPLKKGDPGVHGTLMAGPGAGAGDYYYLQLPVGYWRFTLKLSVPPLPGNLPKGEFTGYGANVYLLDERGVTLPKQFLYASYLTGGPNPVGVEKVIKVDAPEFVKLHAHAFMVTGVNADIPRLTKPLTYTLSVEAADASEYQPDPPGQ